MSIASTTRKAGPYTGNGVTTIFPFSFKVFSSSDLVVTQTDTSGVETTLTLTSNYTVSLNANQDTNPGGNVTCLVAPASSYLLTLTSAVPQLQPVVLTNNGGFYPSVINDALDRLTIFAQQILEKVNRTLSLPVSVSGVSTTLPVPVSNRVIAWNEAATGLQSLDPSSLASIVAFGTANADIFSGTGTKTSFTLSANPGAINNLDVSITGITQKPSIDYTWTSGTTLIFTTAPAAGSNNILVRYLQALPQGSSDSASASFIQSGTGAVQRIAQDKLRETISVKDFGAVGDGNTDDAAAIQAALNSGSRSVFLPPARYRCATGITIPGGVTLYSTGFVTGNDGSLGTGLTFDLSVATCITFGVSNTGGGIKGFSVARAAGSIPASSIGILVKNTYGIIIEDVGVYRHSIGIKFLGDRATAGICAMVNRLFVGTISDTHVLIDTFPEVRFNHCRFGQNGAFDLNCNSFIKVIGGSTTNPANGPNTLVAVNCQFNQGQNLAAAWLSFASQQAGSISDIALWQFDTCYIETCSAGITSDATWTSLQGLQISNTMFNNVSGTPFLSLNAATAVHQWALSNNIINGTFALAPTAQLDFISVSNTIFSGLVSISGVSSSTVSFNENTYRGGLTIAGAFASGFGRFSGEITAGVLTDTSSGNKATLDLAPFNELTNWQPTINFGGLSVGVAYSVRQATYQIIGRKVFCNFAITLTSKGSSTGILTITGIPTAIAADPSFAGASGGGLATYILYAAALTSPIMLSVNSSTVNTYVQSATGVTSVTDVNITNTTDFRGSFVYTRV